MINVAMIHAESNATFNLAVSVFSPPCPGPFSLEISKNRPIDADSG
jgi:hypothetical protein